MQRADAKWSRRARASDVLTSPLRGRWTAPLLSLCLLLAACGAAQSSLPPSSCMAVEARLPALARELAARAYSPRRPSSGPRLLPLAVASASLCGESAPARGRRYDLLASEPLELLTKPLPDEERRSKAKLPGRNNPARLTHSWPCPSARRCSPPQPTEYLP
jgi:hypothetical protein